MNALHLNKHYSITGYYYHKLELVKILDHDFISALEIFEQEDNHVLSSLIHLIFVLVCYKKQEMKDGARYSIFIGIAILQIKQ